MSELMELLRFCTETGNAVIPWAVFALGVYFTVQTMPHVLEWLRTRTEAQRTVAARESERNEIMRNSNAVIENCTETMKMLKVFMESETGAAVRAVDHHESLSMERFDRLQQKADENSTELNRLRSDTGILLDRVRSK